MTRKSTKARSSASPFPDFAVETVLGFCDAITDFQVLAFVARVWRKESHRLAARARVPNSTICEKHVLEQLTTATRVSLMLANAMRTAKNIAPLLTWQLSQMSRPLALDVGMVVHAPESLLGRCPLCMTHEVEPGHTSVNILEMACKNNDRKCIAVARMFGVGTVTKSVCVELMCHHTNSVLRSIINDGLMRRADIVDACAHTNNVKLLRWATARHSDVRDCLLETASSAFKTAVSRGSVDCARLLGIHIPTHRYSQAECLQLCKMALKTHNLVAMVEVVRRVMTKSAFRSAIFSCTHLILSQRTTDILVWLRTNKFVLDHAAVFVFACSVDEPDILNAYSDVDVDYTTFVPDAMEVAMDQEAVRVMQWMQKHYVSNDTCRLHTQYIINHWARNSNHSLHFTEAVVCGWRAVHPTANSSVLIECFRDDQRVYIQSLLTVHT